MTKRLDRSLDDLVANVRLYAQLKRELGARGVEERVDRVKNELMTAIESIRALPNDAALTAREPDDLPTIRTQRPEARKGTVSVPSDEDYRDRLEGAFLGRSAGCILGSPVEGWTTERMETWAHAIGDTFPPVDYWSSVPDPAKKRYKTIPRDAYTRSKMDGIPVDDDLQYTLLGLLILEDHGAAFTVDDVATAWLKYLPFACTAEDVALANIRHGVSAAEAGASGGQPPLARSCYMSEELPETLDQPLDNPYYQWIGADIRSDPWGYVAPGDPQRAATLAYTDAYLSHRRNGLYGEMFFSAAIAAAFTVDDPMEALRVGLDEIPMESSLARAVRWALEIAPEIRTFRDAAQAIGDEFPGMHSVHTINNACLTVWGIAIGGTDFSRVISETVAMGYDNDCTAATAGSIVGAVVGRDGIPRHWTTPFGDTIHTYLKGIDRFSISDVLERFAIQKNRVMGIR
jgi:ADP-ribosylglycohydrolase